MDLATEMPSLMFRLLKPLAVKVEDRQSKFWRGFQSLCDLFLCMPFEGSGTDSEMQY